MIHLVKLCVGAESIDDLAYWQTRGANKLKIDGVSCPVHETRQTPKKMEELLDGGSIYWVIKGTILVRQTILAVRTREDLHGRNFCQLAFDPELVATEPQGRKAFQGWRYLQPADAPADLKGSDVSDVPPELTRALLEAGVW